MKSLNEMAAGMVIFLLLWQLSAWFIGTGFIVPAPIDVFRILSDLILDSKILLAAWHTAWKVFLSISLVLIVGVTMGFILGLVEPLYEMLRPIILIIQAVPVVSWLSLVIFAWGIGWRGPVFIAFLSLIPMAVLTTVSGVKNLDKNLLEMARVYKIPKRKVLRDIYLGSLIPFIIAIIDVTLGQAWKVILVAEYLSGKSGLGVQILSARYEVNVAKVWALTLLAVFLGIITERIIKKLLERVSKRWMPV